MKNGSDYTWHGTARSPQDRILGENQVKSGASLELEGDKGDIAFAARIGGAASKIIDSITSYRIFSEQKRIRNTVQKELCMVGSFMMSDSTFDLQWKVETDKFLNLKAGSSVCGVVAVTEKQFRRAETFFQRIQREATILQAFDSTLLPSIVEIYSDKVRFLSKERQILSCPGCIRKIDQKEFILRARSERERMNRVISDRLVQIEIRLGAIKRHFG